MAATRSAATAFPASQPNPVLPPPSPPASAPSQYALFTNLLTTFVYLPTSWGYVYFNWSKLTDDEKAIPWYKWAIMGGLDSMAGILQSIAVAFVSNGTLVTLLLQSAIPVSMIFTRLFTKKRYKWFNYVGAVAVLIGIAIVLAPKLAQPDSDSTSSGPGGLIVWALVLVASCVPMTLSSERCCGPAPGRPRSRPQPRTQQPGLPPGAFAAGLGDAGRTAQPAPADGAWSGLRRADRASQHCVPG